MVTRDAPLPALTFSMQLSLLQIIEDVQAIQKALLRLGISQ
jgi:hypothetical protein